MSNTFEGEQGPYADSVIGWYPQSLDVKDYGTGWEYRLHTFCPSWPDKCSGCEVVECPKCREQESIDEETGKAFCWHCDDAVPIEWEHQHELALGLTIGLLTRRME